MNIKTAGLRPAPHELFEKSSTKTLLKSRFARFFNNFCPAFRGRSERSERFPRHPLKSGWGLGLSPGEVGSRQRGRPANARSA